MTRDTYSAIKVWSMDLEGQMAKIEELVSRFSLRMLNASVERDLVKQEFFIEFELKLVNREIAYRMLDDILALQGVKRVRLE